MTFLILYFCSLTDFYSKNDQILQNCLSIYTCLKAPQELSLSLLSVIAFLRERLTLKSFFFLLILKVQIFL